MSEIRFDALTLPKIKKTKQGFLKGEAIITRTGVFEYMNKDGSIRKELRHHDDVFKKDSLDTIKNIPITIDHPHFFVDVNNANKVSVGLTGDNVKIDNNYIISQLTITHKDAIDAINNGKVCLSLGYSTKTIKENGVYEGIEYTHRQTDIEYNHLSLVEAGRAGPQARLNFDSNSNVLFSTTNLNNNNNNEEIMIENRDNDIINKYSEIKMNYDSLKATFARLEAERDHLKSELEELKAINIEKKVEEATKERVDILLKASKLTNLDSLMNKTNKEIMIETIKIKDKSINLDSKEDSYINGRFDAIIESLSNNENLQKQISNIEIKSDSKSDLKTIDFMSLNKFLIQSNK